MLARAKRAPHLDPPASSYAIMRRACPYRGENPGPGKDVSKGSLTEGPELENSLGHLQTRVHRAPIMVPLCLPARPQRLLPLRDH
jgi:hypothetical protein